jgi:hypothetical protein
MLPSIHLSHLPTAAVHHHHRPCFLQSSQIQQVNLFILHSPHFNDAITHGSMFQSAMAVGQLYLSSSSGVGS